MPELPRLGDLVADAIDVHGKGTADLLRRLDQDEPVDLGAEAVACLGDLAQTGARFFRFWDNIATLLAADGDGPLKHPPPQQCARGEIHDFVLDIPDVRSVAMTTGLRRRGERGPVIAPAAIEVRTRNNKIELKVDCSGVPRGLYEGTLSATAPSGNAVTRSFNVYIDPKPRP
jgi:hypothetical protein